MAFWFSVQEFSKDLQSIYIIFFRLKDHVKMQDTAERLFLIKLCFFVYSKSEYTIESASVSGGLHDNSSKLHPIKLKFYT
jgi:hypothetical protein